MHHLVFAILCFPIIYGIITSYGPFSFEKLYWSSFVFLFFYGACYDHKYAIYAFVEFFAFIAYCLVVGVYEKWSLGGLLALGAIAYFYYATHKK